MTDRHVVVYSLNPPSWRWFESRFDRVQWHFFCTLPPRRLERWLKRRVFGRIAAGFEAAWAARRLDAALVIAVDPRAALWYAFAAALLDRRRRLIAYAFNFPELPVGFRRRFMTWAFRRPERFVVFSSVEIDLYADYFDIPREKFEMHRWAVGTPVLAPEAPAIPRPYVSAIGGNGRDYRTLFEAARLVPHIPIEVVTRPENLAGLERPSNVEVRCNVPNAVAMRLLGDSRFMVLPLKNETIPVGHVTLVAAMHLGKASIVTASEGVRDYLGGNGHVLTCPAGNAAELAGAMRKLWDDEVLTRQLGQRAKAFAEQHCTEETAIEHLRALLAGAGLCGISGDR
jgi:glycosyltransferase involved in cell wall biosynthesis